jgi:probable phosphoglycerate mutase
VSLPELWLVRHGETEWSATGRHTSYTDLPLTPAGRAGAARLAPVLAAHEFALVLRSPMKRSEETAAEAGFPDAIVDDDLHEWNYGDLEGLTSEEIRARKGGAFGAWRIFDGPVPGGETLAAVAVRAVRVLERAQAAGGDVLCFGHGHALRVLTAMALDLGAHAGARFALEPATVNVIASEHDQRALLTWNRSY